MAQRDDDIDFSQRELCSDGACIGVIGNDGRCKECGKPGKGMRNGGHGKAGGKPVYEPPKVEEALTREAESEQQELDESDQRAATALAPPEAPPDWDDRKLCPDGACIGLIGKDGLCSECGRKAD